MPNDPILDAIRQEGLNARQLRTARRVAEKHGLPFASDFEAVKVLRDRGIDPFQRNNLMGGNICDAIVTPQPGDLTFPILKRLCGPGIAVSEEDVLHAMAQAFLRLKLVAEPGGAVALAAALYHADEIEGDTVVAVITGGNVDPAMFARALGRT